MLLVQDAEHLLRAGSPFLEMLLAHRQAQGESNANANANAQSQDQDPRVDQESFGTPLGHHEDQETFDAARLAASREVARLASLKRPSKVTGMGVGHPHSLGRWMPARDGRGGQALNH